MKYYSFCYCNDLYWGVEGHATRSNLYMDRGPLPPPNLLPTFFSQPLNKVLLVSNFFLVHCYAAVNSAFQTPSPVYRRKGHSPPIPCVPPVPLPYVSPPLPCVTPPVSVLSLPCVSPSPPLCHSLPLTCVSPSPSLVSVLPPPLCQSLPCEYSRSLAMPIHVCSLCREP